MQLLYMQNASSINVYNFLKPSDADPKNSFYPVDTHPDSDNE